ncbi:MAG: nucleoside triphosphate pyrophosphohydrolase [Anaerolineae bacterium]|nr:MAG: nucleoside triphosphate pyrophosphohydrolase [Anaerolineae bacterium]
MPATPAITLLGLGPGGPDLLTRRAWQVLESASEVWLRTAQHPAVAGLPENIAVQSFDSYYEEEDDFVVVYERIVAEVLRLAERPGGVVYAVPGHPLVAEATGSEILRRALENGLTVEVVEGLSFLEPTWTALTADPLPHTSIVDALDLMTAHHPPFPPSYPALIAQVHSNFVAGEVKITLMALYPDEHPVRLVHAAGTPQQLVEDLPLHAIDQSAHTGLLTSLYLPPLAANTAFEDFQELIAHLRAPEGCPWDREQDHQTLRPNLMEEAFEALAAIDADDPAALREELGDLLLQIVLHAQIAAEYGEFNMSDILLGIHTKLVRRHPHVFGDADIKDAEKVIQNWEKLKEQERKANGEKVKGLLDGIPVAMPALAVADAYQKRAARVGFEWPEIRGVWDKLDEELAELKAAQTPEHVAEEMGDVLFVVANLARWLKVDPETALRQTNAKFSTRFAAIEAEARRQNRELSSMSLEEMDAVWNKAKGR